MSQKEEIRYFFGDTLFESKTFHFFHLSILLLGSSNISEEHREHSKKYGVPLDCTWIIRAEVGKKLYLQFTEYELQMPNDCNYNFIQLFDGKTDIEGRKHNFCGSVAENYVSESEVLYIR